MSRRRSRMPKLDPLSGVEIDPRDHQRDLWDWLLADSQQRKEIRKMHSNIAKQRPDAYWIDHAEAVEEAHRRTREVWLTDPEYLLTQAENES